MLAHVKLFAKRGRMLKSVETDIYKMQENIVCEHELCSFTFEPFVGLLSVGRIFFSITDGYNNRLAHERKNIWSDLENLLQSSLTPYCFKCFAQNALLCIVCNAYTSSLILFLFCSFFILRYVYIQGQSLSINQYKDKNDKNISWEYFFVNC